MLNEGIALRRNLDEIDYEISTTHPDVKTPGKNPGYRIGLDNNGLPQTIDELDADTMSHLWTHREGKHNSFPVIRIQNALLNVRQTVKRTEARSKQRKKRTKQERRMVKMLERCVSMFSILLPDANLWSRLHEKAQHFLDNFGNVDDRYVALPIMLRRFVSTGISPEEWFCHLARLIVHRLGQGHLQDIILAKKMLIGSLDKKSPQKPARAEVPLVLDVAESHYPVPVADMRMGSYVSHRLRALETQESDGICALQGKPCALLKIRPPEPNLGQLGETKLFSKNRAAPCEFRYIKRLAEHKDTSKSFPMGQLVASDIADGYKTITNDALKGKTWRMVANGKWEGSGRNKRENKDLLIVYCDGQPVIDAQVADTFGNDFQERRDQFENNAKAVCQALEGVLKHHPKARLHLLTIGKADKEKKQIHLHMTPTVSEVVEAAERWQRAVRGNLPPITLPLPPAKKGEKAIQANPQPPYPDRVVRLLSSQWIRKGFEEHKTQGPPLRLILDLMLSSSSKRQEAAVILLDAILQRAGTLLIGVFGAIRSGKKENIEHYPPFSRETALRAVAVFGILLDALASRKESYMKNAPYQIGQVLSLADTLHKDYCIVVRKDQLPNTLVGTSLMRRALDNPAGALADLGERMMEYIRWAKVAQIDKKWSEDDQKKIAVNEARKKLRQYQPLTKLLGSCDLPQECDDVMKAQILLGFLATPPEED